MFKEFLRINPDNPGDTSRQERLFKGLDVMRDTELVEKYMGQYPVVSMTLKSVYGKSYEWAVQKLAALITGTASDFEFLENSKKLSDREKKQLEIYLNVDELLEPKNLFKLTEFLKFISNALFRHFGRQVVLLIDEYDVPLAKARIYGCHSGMVTLYSQFLDILKQAAT